MSEQWIEPPRQPLVADGEAHVWLAHLPSCRAHLAQYTECLSQDETERARKFHFAGHRERWQITRGILRHLLARYLTVAAREIAFDYGVQGKPALKFPSDSRLHFNTSHSGDYAVFAFTRIGEIGVDIERIRKEMPRRDEIARKYFAPGEQRALFALPESERAHAFFTIWARKEAFVKARGTGLFSVLDQFEVALGEPRLLSIANEDAAHWWMAALPSVDGYAGAVIVNSPSATARCMKWQSL